MVLNPRGRSWLVFVAAVLAAIALSWPSGSQGVSARTQFIALAATGVQPRRAGHLRDHHNQGVVQERSFFQPFHQFVQRAKCTVEIAMLKGIVGVGVRGNPDPHRCPGVR